MSMTSGMCSSLNPAFNIWDAAEPYSAQLIRAESGNLAADLAKRALSAGAALVRLPERLDDLTQRLADGTLAVQSPRLERRMLQLERTGRRLVSAVLFGVLLIGGILLRADDRVLGTVLIASSALPLLHALFAGLRRL
jgi:predicted unusual protein kinase regulating ubiquinone biosynthesis (AarF/ABC1/UbiB family)